MNLLEHAGKSLLAVAGINVPQGYVCRNLDEVAVAAEALGPCVVKAQVPAGRRGKAGGIRLADNIEEAVAAAEQVFDMVIGGHVVRELLVEQQVEIVEEIYVALVNDPETKGPMLLFSAEGGMEVEDLVRERPETLLRLPVDIRDGMGQVPLERGVSQLIQILYLLFIEADAELLEINPLVRTVDGELVALDCKLAFDDSSAWRQPDLVEISEPERLTALEARARDMGLRYIELDGDVGILANGAGLTMTTMDAVTHYGGRPANFLEIGGEAYTRAKDALSLVLSNPRVKSLLVNFCGAFARTDVMTEGLLAAWDEVPDDMPVFFTIHGTGDEEAVAMIRDRLGMEPFELMDDAVVAAVEAAR
ncbi:MAG: acetate--CoA ligase family protein, partial [Geminicoccaceae bacterium]|nr:acetate--CoA ligase family protein [Geminicoccaceae bacterium]